MYATSSAVRCVLIGTYCQPAWKTASSVCSSSALFDVSVATGSPVRTPRARNACTSRLAPDSISPAVQARSAGSMTATRSGSARAAAQNPRIGSAVVTSGGRA